MARRTFTLWHSVAGIAALVVIEAAALTRLALPQSAWLVLIASVVGAAGTLYVATEVVEEVRGTPRMLALLSAVVGEFVIFFIFEYWFLLAAEPASFPTLSTDWLSLALHSTMVFVFNPLYVPATNDGRALLLINTLGALGLVLFILQNIWQFRKSSN